MQQHDLLVDHLRVFRCDSEIFQLGDVHEILLTHHLLRVHALELAFGPQVHLEGGRYLE